MADVTKLLLVTGLPAAGKSTLARHLRDQHDYAIFVLEEIGRDRAPTPVEMEVLRLWQAAVSTGDASGLVNKLRSLPGRVVVEWGFPINEPCIRCVESMRDSGMRLLWFECNDATARRRYIDRGTLDVRYFDAQTPQIRACRESLLARLRPDVIDALDPLGASKTVEEIATEIGVT